MDSFPEFAGGDVRIVLTTGRQYQLHASVLKNSSATMRLLLREENAAVLSSRAVRDGATTRWKLVLVPGADEDADHGALPFRLSAVPLSDRGIELRGSSTNIIVENENGRVSDPTFKAFDSILGALYNQPLDLGDAQEDNMADLLQAALDVVDVAGYLGCIRILTGSIEATLLATGQSLYRAIAENPTGWLVFSNRVRSRAIFKEAMIHAVGCYNNDKIQTAIHDGIMHDEIVTILERKAQEVINGVSATLKRLSSYYPASLQRERTVGRIDRDNTGRADYGNDILAWMALSVFRHWVGNMMADDHTTHAKDMGYFFITLIHDGGNKYLSRTVMQQNFHQKFPMSHKGMNAVEYRLTEIKNNVKDFVKGYFRPTCQLDLHRYPVMHYTHINVAAEDYPWHAEEAAASKASINAAMYGPAVVDDEDENEIDEDENEVDEDENEVDDDENEVDDDEHEGDQDADNESSSPPYERGTKIPIYTIDKEKLEGKQTAPHAKATGRWRQAAPRAKDNGKGKQTAPHAKVTGKGKQTPILIESDHEEVDDEDDEEPTHGKDNRPKNHRGEPLDEFNSHQNFDMNVENTFWEDDMDEQNAQNSKMSTAPQEVEPYETGYMLPEDHLLARDGYGGGGYNGDYDRAMPEVNETNFHEYDTDFLNKMFGENNTGTGEERSHKRRRFD